MRRSAAVDTNWRQLVIGVVALWLFLGGAVFLFTWPVARSAPRDLPVAVVASDAAARAIGGQLTRSGSTAFRVHRYAAEAGARRAVLRRDVYGAYVVAGPRLTLITAGAASSTVASLLASQGDGIAESLDVRVDVTDAVPYAPTDPRGLVFSIVLLPLTVCSVTIAMVIALIARTMRAWWQLLALLAVAVVGALLTYLVAQTWLGALPHQPVLSWASMALMVLSISATASGFIALLGTAGTAVAAALLIFVGNSFAGSQSAPYLLPRVTRVIGQILPPGAGAGLLRSTTYFDGFGWFDSFLVLLGWVVAGCVAVLVGHQRTLRSALAAEPSSVPQST